MLRDAFYRMALDAHAAYKIVLAEDAKPLTSDAGYKDLFEFESDIAQLVGLILLFAESAGSLAELGAFAAIESVAPRLLAVLDDYYYKENSFIRNGPIAFLEHRHGEEWVHVLERAELRIADDGSISNINAPLLFANVDDAVKARLENRKTWTKFDRKNSGHVILLITGLCQEYGALTQKEIRSYLVKIGIEQIRFDNYIYCSELLGWIRKIRKGNHIFYVGTVGDAAIDYKLMDSSNIRDKVRWRTDVRSYWKEKDSIRLRAIAEVMSGLEVGS